jgi:hypothetical protein
VESARADLSQRVPTFLTGIASFQDGYLIIGWFVGSRKSEIGASPDSQNRVKNSVEASSVRRREVGNKS